MPGTAMIYLRITIEGKRTEFSLQRQCDPAKWIPSKGRLAGKGNIQVAILCHRIFAAKKLSLNLQRM